MTLGKVRQTLSGLGFGVKHDSWHTRNMPKRSSTPKRPSDPNLLARQIVEEAIGEPLTDKKVLSFPKRQSEKNPAAVALGKLGGMKGGKARAEKLTPVERKQIAQRAARARWAKKAE
jgi:hypothetical protein